jgi:alkanesulfonate monooxygenase SsuD/methylene tetrahydromethanopterin reductase-like flavin-dependent oxidoreductase (luciferase family)
MCGTHAESVHCLQRKGAKTVRVSLNITNYSWPGEVSEIGSHLGRVVRAADDAGVDTAWVADHLIQADPNSVPDAEMLEAYCALTFLAAQTVRIRLGTMVTAVTIRKPAQLVKIVTTLDVLSGGRSWLGIGAGYHDSEARAMGLPRPPVAERFELLEETLHIALHMWSDRDTTPFKGKHYQLERPVTNPKPVRRPHPPILIGGMGEQKTLPS